jgi:rhodanese-related sulfurtransferase
MRMTLRIMMVGILLLASVTAVGALAGCTSGEQQEEEEEVGNYTDLSAAEAKQLIDDNSDVIIIDVSPDYAAGHLPGAVSYYLGDGSLDAAIPTLDKDATYLVYCHAEGPARTGAQKLVDAGFTDAYRLDGDYAAWVAAGYAIET